jgi:hypothetical protein
MEAMLKDEMMSKFPIFMTPPKAQCSNNTRKARKLALTSPSSSEEDSITSSRNLSGTKSKWGQKSSRVELNHVELDSESDSSTSARSQWKKKKKAKK